MTFKLVQTAQVTEALASLESSAPKRAKAVKKALGFLEANPRHTGLNSKKHHTLSARLKRNVMESRAENERPGAYRIFWYYSDNEGEIVVFSLVPHD